MIVLLGTIAIEVVLEEACLSGLAPEHEPTVMAALDIIHGVAMAMVRILALRREALDEVKESIKVILADCVRRTIIRPGVVEVP